MQPWVRWQLSIGVRIYDLLCGRRNLGPSSTLSISQMIEKLPDINCERLTGGVRYFDGLTSDARLTLDTLRSAVRHDALVRNQTALLAAQPTASGWTAQLRDESLVRQELCNRIAAKIDTVDPAEQVGKNSRQCRVIALIGPTGVGKTTTIAKLAANYKLRQGLRVGMITIDTYRVAAVDQLQTYAEIVEVPLRTVLTPPELRQAVYALRGMDVVLIDTTGRSQNDLLRLSQLRSFLDAADADEVHVVVSAASNPRCIRGILERFAPLGANRMLVTKMDEAATCGALLDMARIGVGPLGYVTSGQEVPDDIAAANAEDIAWKIMGGRENA